MSDPRGLGRSVPVRKHPTEPRAIGVILLGVIPPGCVLPGRLRHAVPTAQMVCVPVAALRHAFTPHLGRPRPLDALRRLLTVRRSTRRDRAGAHQRRP